MLLINGDSLKTLITQRKPMIMVDILYDALELDAYTGLKITSDNMFCNEGFFTEPGLVEHIAQSVAAFVGYKALLTNKHIPLCFLAEVKKCSIRFLPRAGDSLLPRIQLLSETLAVSLFDAETSTSSHVVAQCKMKIFVKKTEQDLQD